MQPNDYTGLVGIWSTVSKKFVFGIQAETKAAAWSQLRYMLKRDSGKVRFQVRRIQEKHRPMFRYGLDYKKGRMSPVEEGIVKLQGYIRDIEMTMLRISDEENGLKGRTIIHKGRKVKILSTNARLSIVWVVPEEGDDVAYYMSFTEVIEAVDK